jgi:hypothetical protein
VLICDLCGGDPECAKTCQKGKWNALCVVKRADEELMNRYRSYKLYSRTPEEITKDLVISMYGETGEELI